MDAPTYKRVSAGDLLSDSDAAVYEDWQDEIYERLLHIHHAITVLETMGQYPLDLICTPSEQGFWRTVAQSCWHAATSDLHGLVDDQTPDVITIPRLKGLLLKFAWSESEVKLEFGRTIRHEQFDQRTRELRKKVTNFRHYVYAHSKRNDVREQDLGLSYTLSLEELRRAFDAVRRFFEICSLGDWVETTQFLYSGESLRGIDAEIPGVDAVLTTLARSSRFVTQVESAGADWPGMRDSLTPEHLSALNNLRSTLCLPPA